MNLFADMGVQPATMPAGLVAATASTDNTAPTATITSSPGDGGRRHPGHDLRHRLRRRRRPRRGRRALDRRRHDLASRRPARRAGRTRWVAHGNPSATLKVRAVDDSGNLGTAERRHHLNVSCPCSLWGPNTTVPVDDRDSADPTPAEVGVKFKADKFGTDLRPALLQGGDEHRHPRRHAVVGSPASRWRRRRSPASRHPAGRPSRFSSPVAVQPNTTYVASYYAPNGHFSASAAYFYNAPAPGPNGGAVVDSPPLHAVAQHRHAPRNGVYRYGAATHVPDQQLRRAPTTGST